MRSPQGILGSLAVGFMEVVTWSGLQLAGLVWHLGVRGETAGQAGLG